MRRSELPEAGGEEGRGARLVLGAVVLSDRWALCARIVRECTILLLSMANLTYLFAPTLALQSEAPTAKIVASRNSMRSRTDFPAGTLTGAGRGGCGVGGAVGAPQTMGSARPVTFVIRQRSGSCPQDDRRR